MPPNPKVRSPVSPPEWIYGYVLSTENRKILLNLHAQLLFEQEFLVYHRKKGYIYIQIVRELYSSERGISVLGNERTAFAVLGGGNGGHAFAAHLSLKGYPVMLYDISPATVAEVNRQGGIYVDGALNGFASVRATLDIGEAVEGAKVVMIVTPAFAHLDVARKLLPVLRPDQTIVLNPGSTFGALEVWHELRLHRLQNTITETQTLLYACRLHKHGAVHVGAIKTSVGVASIPSTNVSSVVDLLNGPFGVFEPRDSILETSLSNINAVVHPASLIMMMSRIEAGQSDFEFYRHGMSQSIVRVCEALDSERLALGKMLGVDLESVAAWYRRSYLLDFPDLLQLMRNNPAYAGLKAPQTVSTRYLTEDIPYGLVPMYSLGGLISYEMKLCRAVIEVGSAVLGVSLMETGRVLTDYDLGATTPETLGERLRSLK
jgi:opine dehydrogenase